MRPPVRVFIVDDHAIVRDGLRSVLERERDLVVSGEAAGGDAAIAGIAALRDEAGAPPDVVVLDLRLGECDAFELCRELVGEHPSTKVLVFTTYLEERLVVEAVSAGAAGYVVKDVDTSRLLHAIRVVATGGQAFDGRTAGILAGALGRKDEQAGLRMSRRETEVLQLVARGLPNKAIAEQLFIAETTVKFHVGNILHKLGVSRRAEVHWRASQLGLLERS